MADQLYLKRDDIPVLVGDMATSTVPGTFSLVYVVWNSIGNLRSQAEQVACFRNAAHHLAPGGRFVVERRQERVTALLAAGGRRAISQAALAGY